MAVNRFDYRKIRQMLLFAVVVQEGSLRAAAHRLNMSQPPLSAQIDELEDRLKVKLLVRGPRGVRMTEAGEAFLPLVHNFIAQAEVLESSIEELRSGHRAMITVGAVSEAMLSWMPGFKARLQKSAPGIALFTKEIDSADAGRELAGNTVALAVGFFGGFKEAGLRRVVVRREKPVVMLPADHRLAAGLEVRLEDLAGDDWVFQQRNVTPQIVDMILGQCARHGFSPRIRHEVPGTLRQLAYVGCGQGVAMLPEFYSTMLPAAVVARPIAGSRPVVELSVAWNANLASAVRDRALAAALDCSVDKLAARTGALSG